MSDFISNPNPWILTIIAGLIVSVGASLIVYHIFRVGKADAKQKKIETASQEASLVPSVPLKTDNPATTSGNPRQAFFQLTPKGVVEHLGSLPPFQKEEAVSYYKGQKVSWIVQFVGIRKLDNGKHQLHLQYCEQFFTESIFCEIDINNYPQLKIMPRDQEIRIEGEISNVSSYIDLINCKLFF